jgi:hypothetical protein
MGNIQIILNDISSCHFTGFVPVADIVTTPWDCRNRILFKNMSQCTIAASWTLADPCTTGDTTKGGAQASSATKHFSDVILQEIADNAYPIRQRQNMQLIGRASRHSWKRLRMCYSGVKVASPPHNTVAPRSGGTM